VPNVLFQQRVTAVVSRCHRRQDSRLLVGMCDSTNNVSTPDRWVTPCTKSRSEPTLRIGRQPTPAGPQGSPSGKSTSPLVEVKN